MANKSDLVDLIKAQTGFTKQDSEKALNADLDGLVSIFSKSEGITFLNFGSFVVKDVPAAERRNPKTGEKIQVPACKALKFKASDGLKRTINDNS